YRDNLEHLHDELVRVDLLLRRGVVIARTAPDSHVPPDLRGLVVSDEAVDAAFGTSGPLMDYWQRQRQAAAALAPIERELAAQRLQIDRRRQQTQEEGRRLCLPHLAQAFGLSPAEVDLLLIALAPALEPQYEMLCAY